MRTREKILCIVIELSNAIGRYQDEINSLYNEAKEMKDDDDEDGKYLACIKSYFNDNF